jgi:TrmH family RNA methyltransferase
METITSLDNNHIKEVSKLLQKKYRDEQNLFLVESYHLVEEAYKANLLKEVICVPEADPSYDIKTTYVSYEVLKKLTDTVTPQKIIGVVEKKKEEQVGNKVLILDNIQDPGNLGTLIRSSVAFNFDTVILSDDTVDIYNPKVIRSTEGMLFKINTIRKNLEEILPILKEDNYYIYGTKVTGGKTLKSIENNHDKFGIIIGNEGNGIKDTTSSLCDEFIYIPINKECESLNAGISGSIIMYELGDK